ncbi:MAG: glutaminase A [Pseudomonadota bacterium]
MTDQNLNAVFRSLDERGTGNVSRSALVERLSMAGVQLDDPRLEGLRERLDVTNRAPLRSSTFASLLDNGGSLVSRAIKGDLVIPDFAAFTKEVRELAGQVRQVNDGAVADYIPQLARVPEDSYAVAVCTIDGQRLSIGDSDTRFTLQSSCKPFLYAAALEEHGEHKVHAHVGREPSGMSFNELTLNRQGLPHNPMINAGAIMTSSLLRRDLPTADRLEYLTSLVSALAARERLSLNAAVWHSERESADRNFALAHHMRERGAFPPGIEIRPTLDYYFSACSMEVTARSMATIGATLANGGVCPLTGERVLCDETIKNTLSMMYSCGMYDYSGEFAFCVGIPAKSAVSGVVLAVVPNVMSVVVWSPKLDACGNSVRGVAFLKGLVGRFSLHNYDSLLDTKKRDPRRLRNAVLSDHTYHAIYAASIGDVSELRRLVAHGHDLNKADYDGRTPLHLASAEGHSETVQYLLHQKVCPAPIDRWGNTPLADATRHGQDAVRTLLAAAA